MKGVEMTREWGSEEKDDVGIFVYITQGWLVFLPEPQ